MGIIAASNAVIEPIHCQFLVADVTEAGKFGTFMYIRTTEGEGVIVMVIFEGGRHGSTALVNQEVTATTLIRYASMLIAASVTEE